MHTLAIGVFDSGVGGLSVRQEITKLMPNENILYFGDTARVPYGNKSPETIIRYTLECATFLKDKIKLLVVACNTSSSCSLEPLRKIMNVPVIGVILPAAQEAAKTTQNGRIGILGTRATIQSAIYQKTIKTYLPDSQLFGVACPLFVPLVEENFFHHPSTKLIIETYLAELKRQSIDTLLLGCTHYPFLSDLIRQEMGPGVKLVDSGRSCALQVKKVIEEHNMRSTGAGMSRYFVTDEPQKFKELGEQLTSCPFESIEKIVLS